MTSVHKSNFPQIARQSGFRLRQFKDGPLDWRLVGSMEVDRILREQQFEHIDAILFHLSEAPLAFMLDSNVLDSGVAKYFSLLQLALQYMIFCRTFLDESVSTLRDNIIKLETQNLHLKTINEDNTNDIVNLHKKLSQVESIHEIVFPCHVCTKNFVSNDALNVHLSKKHLKRPSTDIQGKDNDQTLINTIKLELEIKQLKERLNIAEKDIRQSSEIKRISTREITKISSSTQIEIQTQNVGTQSGFDETKIAYSSPNKDVGTQCNLFEAKECDSACDLRHHQNLNIPKESNCEDRESILFEIQEKISKLEELQKTYSSGNQQSINEIKRQLSQITEFLETQTKQNADSVEKDAILSSNSPHQVLTPTSIDQLQRILSNMCSELSQTNSEKMNRIITRIENSFEQKMSSLKVQTEGNKNVDLHNKLQALESQCLKNSDSIMQRHEPILDNVYSSYLTKSLERSSKCTSSEVRTDSSHNNTFDLESHHSFFFKEPNDFKESRAFKKFENKMEHYGLNINSKKISVNEAAKISAHLKERRKGFKKIYPAFFTTRSKLNKFVEFLISEKKLNRDALQKPNTKYKEIESVNQKYTISQETDENIATKKRIEMILRPPIKKPSSYVSRNKRDEKKPIPLPRKHVMFHTENENSDGESSVK